MSLNKIARSGFLRAPCWESLLSVGALERSVVVLAVCWQSQTGIDSLRATEAATPEFRSYG
jgi:hypothetical protein